MPTYILPWGQFQCYYRENHTFTSNRISKSELLKSVSISKNLDIRKFILVFAHISLRYLSVFTELLRPIGGYIAYIGVQIYLSIMKCFIFTSSLVYTKQIRIISCTNISVGVWGGWGRRRGRVLYRQRHTYTR